MGNIKSTKNVTATHTSFDIERIVVLWRDVLVWPLLTRIGCSPVLCTARQPQIFPSKIGRFLGLPTRGAASPTCTFGWGRMPGKTINTDLTKATRSMNTRSLMAQLSQPQLLTTVSIALLAGKVSRKCPAVGTQALRNWLRKGTYRYLALGSRLVILPMVSKAGKFRASQKAEQGRPWGSRGCIS
jgi:hypothetical protein